METAVFWNMTSCSLAEVYSRFRKPAHCSIREDYGGNTRPVRKVSDHFEYL